MIKSKENDFHPVAVVKESPHKKTTEEESYYEEETK